MSRFYDALHHAGRAVRTSNEEEQAPSPWEPFGVRSITVSPAAAPERTTPQHPSADAPAVATASVATVAEATPASAATPAIPSLVSDETPVIVAPETGNPEQREGNPADTAVAIGKRARVNVDKTARVMPNVSDQVVVEHYRRLRAKLMQQQSATPFRTLMVTSANPQEGKSVTTLNLAFSFAMLPSFRTLVIDGDLRRGSLSKWLGVHDQAGFSNLIEGTASLDEVILRCDQMPIHFMVSGNSALPPAELLHSKELAQHLAAIAGQFDLVLLDSPPVNVLSDTQQLASHCDAILLVARAFTTRCKAFEKMVHDISSCGRILGVVLNGGARLKPYHYSGYY